MTAPPLLTGPLALFANFPIQPQNFQPSQFFITAISMGQATTVTTSVNNNYVIGQLCRLLIPITNGCRELNEVTGYVINIPLPNQVVLNINSQGITPFMSSSSPTQPQIVAVGEVNTGDINANGRSPTATFIPGSFINISL